MKPGVDGLDMEIHQFVCDVRQRSARLGSDHCMTWPEHRRIAAKARFPWYQGGPEMDRIEQITLHHLHPVAFAVHLYWPLRVKRVPSPVMVYLHGGGWCMLGVDTHHRLVREYAHAAEIPVMVIDYALAPEFPYPVALEQTVAALEWLRQSGVSGIDADHVLLAGDSAGANLALGAALRLRESGGLGPVKGLLLNYGVWTPQLSRQARETLGTPDAMLSAVEMDGFWHEYLGGDPMGRADAFCAPLWAADLHGLPPSLLLWGERDVLAEQNAHMVQRLRQSGVHVQSKVYPGAPHSFIEAMAVSRQARDAIACGADWAKQYLFACNHTRVNT